MSVGALLGGAAALGTAPGTRAASQRACAEPLAYLECRSSGGDGSTFDPAWAALLEASTRHERAALLRQGGGGAAADEDAGAVVSLDLFMLASTLAERWWPVYAASPAIFDQVMKRRRLPDHLGGLCFYGLVTALFIRAWYGCEVLKDLEGALYDLEMALQMLGSRLHLDFIREASSWPFDALDLRENREMLLQWLNTGQGEGRINDKGVSLRFVLSPARDRPRKPAVATTRLWREHRPGRRQPIDRAADGPLHVAIFGVHTTLLLEPVTMLRVALFPRSLRFRVFMRDCPRGNAVWEHHCLLQCRALGECSPPEGSRQLFVDLVHMFEDTIFGRTPYYAVADYLELLVRMYEMDVQLQQADFYICTAPLMCSLLRAVFEKPLLAYFGMQLHVALDDQKDQLWLMHFREMARDTCSNVMAVHNFAMREQMRYATGVRLDVVRPRALYAHAGVPVWRLAQIHDGASRFAAPHGAVWRQRVLVYRSSYLKVSLFLPLLEAHLSDCGAHPLELRIVRNASDFIEFRELRRYRAAVLFPWDPALMSFYEMYNLNGPAVFLPRQDWIFKVQQLTGWIWSQPSGATQLAGLNGLRGREAARGRLDGAPSPWWQPEDSAPSQTLYWYRYSDCARLPGVIRFGSVADLLQRLLAGSSLRMARRIMRRHNRRALRVGLRWYRSAVDWLLLGASAHPVCVMRSQV